MGARVTIQVAIDQEVAKAAWRKALTEHSSIEAEIEKFLQRYGEDQESNTSA